MLEGGRGVAKAERHYHPLIGTVAGLEHGLPFIAFGDADEMIRMLEVDFGVVSCFTGGV